MTRRNRGLWLLALLLIGAAIFSPGINGPFVLDDVAKIRDNPELKGPFDLKSFFTSYESHKTHFRNDPSRPLTYMVYWGLWHLGAGQPLVFHLASLFFHALTAFGVGLLLLGFGIAPVAAVLASFFYLLLPLNTGTVLYAFGLSDVLSAFLAVWLTVFVIVTETWTVARLALAAGLLILALASKQSAAVLPLLLFLVRPKAVRLHATLLSVVLAYLGLRYSVYGRIGDLEAFNQYPAATYLGTQGWVFWRYVGFALFPHGLCIDHAVLPRQIPDALRAVGWLGWLASVGFAVLFLKDSRFRLLSFGWLWWVITLLPTGSVLPTADLMVERRAYWPAVGLIVALGGALPWFAQRWSRRGVVALSGIILFVFAGISLQRARIYASAETIYQEVIDLYPDDVRGLGNLAVAYIEAKKYAEARVALEKILVLVPEERNALVNLAALYQLPEAGFLDLRKSGELLATLLAREPDNVKALINMGFLHLSLREPNESAFRFAKVIELSPCTASALYGWGKAELMAGRKEVALQKWQEALKCDPGFEPAARELERLK